MVDFAVAVKSFIVDDKGRLLIIKGVAGDVQRPGIWEIPGGRLVLGEDPFVGLRRETREETGLDVEVLRPLSVRHFTRDDGQVVTMLVFLCRPKKGVVRLSGEHCAFEWVGVGDAEGKLTDFFHDELRLFRECCL